MIVSRFDDGSFVVHKIEYKRSTLSAWFTPLGELMGCGYTTNHKMKNVPDNHWRVRQYLVAIGQRYKQA